MSYEDRLRAERQEFADSVTKVIDAMAPLVAQGHLVKLAPGKYRPTGAHVPVPEDRTALPLRPVRPGVRSRSRRAVRPSSSAALLVRAGRRRTTARAVTAEPQPEPALFELSDFPLQTRRSMRRQNRASADACAPAPASD